MPKGTCTIEGCERSDKRIIRGMCEPCYRQWKRDHPETVATRCKDDGCDAVVQAFGFCGKHLYRFKRYGDPTVTKHIYRDHLRRFMSKVDKNGPAPVHHPELGPCWVWLGKKNKWGYGQFTVVDWEGQAHKWLWEHLNGPIPVGTQMDHFACDRRLCVNPSHVRPVTPRENVLRSDSPSARNAAKTHCIHGHPFDEANTYYRSAGGRGCRACARERARVTREHRHPR